MAGVALPAHSSDGMISSLLADDTVDTSAGYSAAHAPEGKDLPLPYLDRPGFDSYHSRDHAEMAEKLLSASGTYDRYVFLQHVVRVRRIVACWAQLVRTACSLARVRIRGAVETDDGDDEWEFVNVTGSQAHLYPDLDPDPDPDRRLIPKLQVIVMLLEEDAWEWHCDDDCPFIERSFRRRRLRNCKTCTPEAAIDADVVICTQTGKCIHKDRDCRHLSHAVRIPAKKCKHCFKESSLA